MQFVNTWDGNNHGQSQTQEETTTQQTNRPLHQEMTRAQWLFVSLVGVVAFLAYVKSDIIASRLGMNLTDYTPPKDLSV